MSLSCDCVKRRLKKSVEHCAHKLIGSVWNKEDFTQQWKESIIIPIYKKGDKTDCNNYR
jgi:hypothetical protein